MAAASGTFLSDVHLCTPFLRTSKENVAFTRFKITRHSECKEHYVSKEVRKIHKDEDGDLSPPRKHATQDGSDVITIEHHLSTPIKDVGLQVWRGALLLCDFLIHNEERCTALELGAGLGLCSIVLGRIAKRVFCTDVGHNILQGCQDNIAMNSHLFKYGCDAVTVHEYDWRNPGLSTDQGAFSWTKEDKEALKEVSVILAADVIYDDSLTDAFIETVLRLLEAKTHIVLFLALEKRLNFTLKDLAVTSPEYNYFFSSLEQLETKEQRLRARKLVTDFPNYLQYERVKELEQCRRDFDILVSKLPQPSKPVANEGRKDQPSHQKAPSSPAGFALVYVHQLLEGSAMKGAAARSLSNLNTIPP